METEKGKERRKGEWYADVAGLTFTLTALGGEAQTGKREEKDGVLIVDGDEESVLLPIGDVIRMDALDLIFTREQPTAYVPAEPIADAKAGKFDGWWKSHFTAVGDGTIPSDAIGEDTELYFEGTKLAVNGTLFGLNQYDGAIEGGKLTFTTDKGPVTLERLPYLMAKPLPDEEPAAPQQWRRSRRRRV